MAKLIIAIIRLEDIYKIDFTFLSNLFVILFFNHLKHDWKELQRVGKIHYKYYI